MRRKRTSAAVALVIAFISIFLPLYFDPSEVRAGREAGQTDECVSAFQGSGEYFTEKTETDTMMVASAGVSGEEEILCIHPSAPGKYPSRQLVLFFMPLFAETAILLRGAVCRRWRALFLPATDFLRELQIRMEKDGKKWMAAVSR